MIDSFPIISSYKTNWFQEVSRTASGYFWICKII